MKPFPFRAATETITSVSRGLSRHGPCAVDSDDEDGVEAVQKADGPDSTIHIIGTTVPPGGQGTGHFDNKVDGSAPRKGSVTVISHISQGSDLDH